MKVAAAAAAFPRLRLPSSEVKAAWGTAPRDVEERRVPAFDEDAVTLAVEAARRVLGAHRPKVVVFVGPGQGAAVVAEALGLDARTLDLAGGALDALALASEPTLLVAADVPRASPGDPREQVEGAGAVALLLDRDGASPVKAPVAALRARIGDLGVAQPLLDLAVALADAKALAFDAPLAAGRTVTYVQALQHRRVLAAASPLPDQPMGAYVPAGTFEASVPARWRLEGARCASCARAYLPAPPRCIECGGPVAAHAFAPRGRVYASTVIGRGGAPSEFAEQQRQTGEYPVVVVELEEGARTVAQVADGDAPAIGAEVEPVLRRLYVQQGVVRYGTKWRAL